MQPMTSRVAASAFVALAVLLMPSVFAYLAASPQSFDGQERGADAARNHGLSHAADPCDHHPDRLKRPRAATVNAVGATIAPDNTVRSRVIALSAAAAASPVATSTAMGLPTWR